MSDISRPCWWRRRPFLRGKSSKKDSQGNSQVNGCNIQCVSWTFPKFHFGIYSERDILCISLCHMWRKINLLIFFFIHIFCFTILLTIYVHFTRWKKFLNQITYIIFQNSPPPFPPKLRNFSFRKLNFFLAKNLNYGITYVYFNNFLI